MTISSSQQQVLVAMSAGWTLKAHRYLDGRKEYRLHALDGASEIIRPEIVETMAERGWIDSNKKFPAATFWLTEQGRLTASAAARSIGFQRPPTPKAR